MKQPNIILIMTDQLRGDALGYAGHPDVKTPYLDTLLSGGVGTPIGSMFGVLINGTISSLITAQGTLSSWWSRIVLSLLLCFFIVIQSVLASASAKRKK